MLSPTAVPDPLLPPPGARVSALRRRPAAWAALAGSLLVSSAAGSQTPQDPAQRPSPAPRFPAQVELVTVDVVVLDKHGNPVEGLTRDDFRVSEDGQPQALVSFEAHGLPESPPAPPPAEARISTNQGPRLRPERSYTLVFDDVHLSTIEADKARAAVGSFLEGALRDGDEVTLVPTSGGPWWTTRMPEGHSDAMRFLARLDGKRAPNTSADWLSDYEAMRVASNRDAAVMTEVIRRFYENGVIADLPPATGGDARARAELDVSPGQALVMGKATEVYANAKTRNASTLRTLERAISSLSEARGRKTVVLVSQGFIYDPTLPEFRAVERAALQASAVVYFLDVRGLTGPPGADAEAGRIIDERDLTLVLNQALRDTEGSSALAVDTGGFSVQNTNALADGLRRIVRDSRSYYLLGYVPADAKRDGKFRKIRVVVSRPGLDVRARKGYYAPSNAKETVKGDALDPRVRRALDSPYDGDAILLRMTSYVLGPSAGEKAGVLLVADADPSSLVFESKRGRFEDSLETFVVVVSRDTGETYRNERRVGLSLPPEVKARLERTWLPVLRDFELPPGRYQARLLVRDLRHGQMGTVRHEFEVPDLKTLRITTPILTDTLQASAQELQAPPRPVPLARRTFAAGSRLFVAYEVHGAARDAATGAPRVAAGYDVHALAGRSLLRKAPEPLSPGPHGELAQTLVLSLQGVAPGDYEVVLTLRDDVANRTTEVAEAFRVEAGS